MNNKMKSFIIAGLSGAFGGVLGSVSGSNSLVVVSLVSAFFAVLFAWFINGIFK